jgi:hypothetical protein
LAIQSVLSPENRAPLTRLEDSMWIEATLFGESFMQSVLATDLFEFGRSGRAHTRDAVRVLCATRWASSCRREN